MVTTEHVKSVDTVTDVTVISPLARNLFLLDGLLFSFQIAQKREPMRGTVWEVGSLDNYLNFPNRLSHSNSNTFNANYAKLHAFRFIIRAMILLVNKMIKI